MSDTRISALPAATAALGADELPINEAGTSKKLTVTQIQSFIIPRTAIIAPAALSGDTNNWNPTGLSTAMGIVISTTGGSHNLTGLVAQAVGTRLRLFMDASGSTTLVHASGSSSAGNQLLAASATNVTLRGLGSVDLIYYSGYWWVLGA